MLVEISDEEYEHILDHRRKLAENKAILDKQKGCTHNRTSFKGTGRDSDWYQCQDCGKMIEE